MSAGPKSRRSQTQSKHGGPPHRVDTRNGVGRSPRRTQGLRQWQYATANPQTGTAHTAKSLRFLNSTVCYLSHNLNKAVKHGIKSQTSLWPPVQYFEIR